MSKSPSRGRERIERAVGGAADGIGRAATSTGKAVRVGARWVARASARGGRAVAEAVADGARQAGRFSSPLVAQVLERTQIARYHTKGGHGFAAEDVNTLVDRAFGRASRIISASNQANGADRLVDGVLVQSKYCATPVETIRAAFDAQGGYRYSGQELEVPRDQYEACVELMSERISEGRVPGVTERADAEKLVRQGTVTYEQARNIARAGTVESLIYDAANQAVTCGAALSISAAVTYAQQRRRGVSRRDAALSAVGSGAMSGLSTLIVGVLSAQVLRTALAAKATVLVRGLLKAAVAGSGSGRQVVESIARASLGRAVHGAAAVNHVSKLFRTNALTGVITLGVTCTPDFYRAALKRSISWRQFTKNALANSGGVAGGTVGWFGGATAGAAVGTAVAPGVGTTIGGIVGGIVGSLGGGVGGSTVARMGLNRIVPDDDEVLRAILRKELERLASCYLVTDEEMTAIAPDIEAVATAGWFKRMFQSEDRGEFVRSEFEPRFQEIVGTKPDRLWNVVLDGFALLVDEYALDDGDRSAVGRKLDEKVDDEWLARMKKAEKWPEFVRAELVPVFEAVVSERPAEILIRVVEKEASLLASEYLLTEDEWEKVSRQIECTVDPPWLERLAGEDDRRAFIRSECEPRFGSIVSERKKVRLPTRLEMKEAMSNLLPARRELRARRRLVGSRG